MSDLEFHFGEDSSEARFTKNGVAYTKRVDPLELPNVLKGNSAFSWGLLPPGTRVFEGTANHLIVGVEFPYDKFDLNTYNYTGGMGSSIKKIKGVALPAGL